MDNRGFIHLDHDSYQDTGCEVAPACLQCPLPQCKYDIPHSGYPTHLRTARDKTIAALLQEGLSVEDIANRLDLTVRTIFRSKARYQAAQ